MSDHSRRDVLTTLASSVALPTVPKGVDLEGDRQRLPDVPDGGAIWLALSVAVASDDFDSVLEGTVRPIASAYERSDAELSREDVRELVRRAARGDFSNHEEYIHRRATEALYGSSE